MSGYHNETARQRWDTLHSERATLYNNWQEYAKYTIQRILLPDGYNANTWELNFGFDSFPARACHHLSNKLMYSMFRTGTPFFRLNPSDDLMKEIQAQTGGRIGKKEVLDSLAIGERKAMDYFESRDCYNKLQLFPYHMLITGNALLEMSEEDDRDGNPILRVLGVDRFVTKRSCDGENVEYVIREPTQFGLLLPEVQDAYAAQVGRKKFEEKVCKYVWVRRNKDNAWEMDTWIDECKLPKKFEGRWPNKDLPWRHLTWSYVNGDDYGRGLVEDVFGDIFAHHTISKAIAEGTVLATEYRWVVNPGGTTLVEDLQNSENGGVLPGNSNDIAIISSNSSANLSISMETLKNYESRLSQAFLMTTGQIRQAERVTAEEVRLYAQELETSLGGVYSRLAAELQRPIAKWLMKKADLTFSDDIQPVIVTGLAALSRGSDVQKIREFCGIMAELENVPPSLRQLLRIDNIASVIAAGIGIDKNELLIPEEEAAALLEAQRQQQLAAAQMSPQAPQAPQPGMPGQPIDQF